MHIFLSAPLQILKHVGEFLIVFRWEIWWEFCGILSDPQDPLNIYIYIYTGLKIPRNFGALFVRTFIAQKTYFVPELRSADVLFDGHFCGHLRGTLPGSFRGECLKD